MEFSAHGPQDSQSLLATPTNGPRPYLEVHGTGVGLLGGSWYLLTNYNCTYKPLISPIECPNMAISTDISTVKICE